MISNVVKTEGALSIKRLMDIPFVNSNVAFKHFFVSFIYRSEHTEFNILVSIPNNYQTCSMVHESKFILNLAFSYAKNDQAFTNKVTI